MRTYPAMVIVEHLDGELTVYGNERVQVLHYIPQDDAGSAIFGRLEYLPLAEMPPEVAATFCWRRGRHVHRGDHCILNMAPASWEGKEIVSGA